MLELPVYDYFWVVLKVSTIVKPSSSIAKVRRSIKSWLESGDKRNDILQKDPNAGIPCDSTHNELKDWVTAARQANGEKMGIAIKADKNTPYSTIKEVMNSLRQIDESRYNLITTLKGEEK